MSFVVFVLVCTAGYAFGRWSFLRRARLVPLLTFLRLTVVADVLYFANWVRWRHRARAFRNL